MWLTDREFVERCTYIVLETNFIAQRALLVELCLNSHRTPGRQRAFNATCRACGMSPKAITVLAIRAWKRGYR